MVFDLRSNEAISVPGEVFSYIVPYPFWLRALPASDEHPITRDLNSVFLPWASSLDTLLTFGGRSFTPLLTTSEFAGTQRGNFEIRPDQEPIYSRESLQPRLLAVAVQGAVGESVSETRMPAADTAGAPVGGGTNGQNADDVRTPQDTVQGQAGAATPAGGDTQAAPGALPAVPDVRALERQAFTGVARGRSVIVGDADFLTDQFVRNAPESLIFALNAIDWLTQTEALLDIRSKQPTPRPLVFESNLEMQTVKYANLAGVPLFFVLLGTLRLFRRRRLTRRTYGE